MPTLWNKGYQAQHNVSEFTIGQDKVLDLVLAPFDVQGSLAHIAMLKEVGLLSPQEHALLHQGLEEIQDRIAQGQFEIEEGVEDVHSQVEFLLTRRYGEVGKKIHAGRSRNDQVLVDLKLYLRHVCRHLAQKTQELFALLQDRSEAFKDRLMPGYTHEQLAMPSSFGLWLGAYAECLVDDVYLLGAAYRICNQNPLGSAAGYGNSFPLDRELTTRLLGFESPHYNSIAAQFTRGKSEKAVANALAGLAATLNKLAADCCLYLCPNFGFLSFPKELTTGSSIMPHKKNPDVWELIRARCNRLLALPNEISLLCTNLGVGYHRDFQLLKDILFPAITSMEECLDMACLMVSHMDVAQDLLESPLYDSLFTVEEVNRLVLEEGLPFREAYQRVGQAVAQGSFRAHKNLHHTHLGSIGNLATAQIAQKMEAALKF